MTAPASNASLTLLLTLLGQGPTTQGPLAQWQNSTTSPCQGGQVVTWNAGDNLVTPPQTPQNAASMCVIVFPNQVFGGGANLFLKGATSDFGYSLGAPVNGFLAFPLGGAFVGGGTGSFYINANAQCEAVIYFL